VLMQPRNWNQPVVWKIVVLVEDLYHSSILLIMIVAAISQPPSSGNTDRAIISHNDLDVCVFEVKGNSCSSV
jgi:hypothetical protein